MSCCLKQPTRPTIPIVTTNDDQTSSSRTNNTPNWKQRGPTAPTTTTTHHSSSLNESKVDPHDDQSKQPTRNSVSATLFNVSESHHWFHRFTSSQVPGVTKLAQVNKNTLFLHVASNSPNREKAKAHALWHPGHGRALSTERWLDERSSSLSCSKCARVWGPPTNGFEHFGVRAHWEGEYLARPLWRHVAHAPAAMGPRRRFVLARGRRMPGARGDLPVYAIEISRQPRVPHGTGARGALHFGWRRGPCTNFPASRRTKRPDLHQIVPAPAVVAGAAVDASTGRCRWGAHRFSARAAHFSPQGTSRTLDHWAGPVGIHHVVEDCCVLWKTERRLPIIPAGLPRDHQPRLLTLRYTLRPSEWRAQSGDKWDVQAIEDFAEGRSLIGKFTSVGPKPKF